MPDDDLRPAASCCACRSTELQPLIVLERHGEPPWIRPHRGMVYRHVVVFLCAACFSAQLEKWDHDCFVMDPEEPWDFYDWYVLEAADALRLRTLLGACPDPLGPGCQCAVHAALQTTFKELHRARWSGFAWNTYGDGTEVHRVSVEIEKGLPRLVARGRPSPRPEPA